MELRSNKTELDVLYVWRWHEIVFWVAVPFSCFGLLWSTHLGRWVPGRRRGRVKYGGLQSSGPGDALPGNTMRMYSAPI